MLMKIMSLKTIADASGPEIDQGALLRYLAETMWVPTAVLSDHIGWEHIDSHSAIATMKYAGVYASGGFTFNDKGEITEFTAERYGDFDGKCRMETWLAKATDYKEFNGFIALSKGRITWKLKTGDFERYRFEVKEMEYNKL
jgi:hypothetical protein